MRVLLVDDHGIVRRGIRDVVSEMFGEVEFGEASDGAAAIDLVSSSTWEIAIVDLSLPNRGGIDLVRELKTRCPAMPILVLSMHQEREYVVRAFRAGASGYVTKSAASEELPGAVRTLLAGKIHVDAARAGEVVAHLVGGSDDVVSSLSDRELQVLRMIGVGRSVKQISIELALSEKTVSTYRTRLLKKLGLEGTGDLIRYAVEHGLV